MRGERGLWELSGIKREDALLGSIVHPELGRLRHVP
jgi:hypothetical protein